MRGADERRVIAALCSTPKMRARAYIAALPSLLREQIIDNAYRRYVTDTLRFISINTAKFSGGSYPEERYHDLIYDLTHTQKVETRTEEEIIAKVRKNGWGGSAK